MYLSTEQQWGHGHSEQTDGQGWWRGGEGGGGMYREGGVETYITICKIHSQWECAAWFRELKPRLSNNIEGWDGEGGGRDVQVGGDMGQPMADSC